MQATIQYIEKELANHYPKLELLGFERLIFESVCGWGYTDQILKKNEKTFRKVLGEIASILDGNRKSRWSKKTDFYTLFVIYIKNLMR